jgi:protoporphyrinogen oxidase
LAKQPKRLTRKQKINKKRHPTEYMEFKDIKIGDWFQVSTGDELLEKLGEKTARIIGYESVNKLSPDLLVRYVSNGE